MRGMVILFATVALSACRVSDAGNEAAANSNAAASATPAATVTLARLDCGHADFKDMNGFFSDRPGVYPPGPGKVVDSCYFIQHGDQQMIWDTGLPLATLKQPMEQGGMTAALSTSLADQLAKGGVKPGDIDIVGISHMHGDHTGQAAQFPQAELIIGRADYDQSAGKNDPFGPWRQGKGGKLTLVVGDKLDIFRDGSVVALHLPGHTPDHLALLVNLASGPVLLTGDLYHTTISREKRSLPGFNTSRPETLASMDKFEALAKQTGAKVVIQHEPNDVAKVPAFPNAAK